MRVLRHAGLKVRLPPAGLCCGRPLYEFGLLRQARDYLRRVTDALENDVRAGTPIVFLEPACLSVFKEELPMMLPHDEQTLRLREQSVLLADFLERDATEARFEPLRRRALVHAHCHHKSVLGFTAERSILERRLGLEIELPESGCCGMAGSFGFEAAKFDVSMRCAERALLPALRSAAADTLVIADGYSCREQIAQCSGRKVVHLAEVLAMAVPEEPPAHRRS